MKYSDIIVNNSDIFNIKKIAELIGMPRQTLEDKLKTENVDPLTEEKLGVILKSINNQINQVR